MGRKILVIDDNDQDRMIMKRFLGKNGYEDLLFSETGKDGIKKVKSEKPDLVIVDTVLPKMNGFEVCRKIRDICGPDTPKIVVITGFIDAVDALKAREAGADDYCVKTGDFSQLIKIVKTFV